jgi:hypothetical protein
MRIENLHTSALSSAVENDHKPDGVRALNNGGIQ